MLDAHPPDPLGIGLKGCVCSAGGCASSISLSISCANAIGAVMFPKEDAAYANPFPERNRQSLEEPRI